MNTINKTKLSCTIYNTHNTLTALDTTTKYNYDVTKGKTTRNTDKKTLANINVSDRFDTRENIPEMAMAFINSLAPKFVYRALKTIYQKNPNEKILSLMYDCIRYNQFNESDSESFAQYLSKIGQNAIDNYLTPLQLETLEKWNNNAPLTDKDIINIKTITKERINANKQIVGEMKLHTYTMVVNETGKRHKKEILPYWTQSFTRYGMVTLQYQYIADSGDVEDLFQEAREAMIRLYRMKLINNFNELHYYRYYVYRKINNLIHKWQSIKKWEGQTIIIHDDETGNEKLMDIATFDKRLNKIDCDTIQDEIIKMLRERLDKRSNIESTIEFYNLHFRQGKTFNECAICMQSNLKTLARMKKRIEKELHTPEMYELLHLAIYG